MAVPVEELRDVRYTVKVRGKEVYLFEDEGRWFVEGRKINICFHSQFMARNAL